MGETSKAPRVARLYVAMLAIVVLLVLQVSFFGAAGKRFAPYVAMVLFGWLALYSVMTGFTVAANRNGSARTWFGIIGALLTSLFLACVVPPNLMPPSRGRQLRRRGRTLLPALEPSHAWAGISMVVGVPLNLRSELAQHWRQMGRTEHASIAAFAHVTLELLAVGAPMELVAAAQRDAHDEVCHAELCFSLARSFDGSAQSPASFPEVHEARSLPHSRADALAQVAVAALVEGAFLEGVSARMLGQLALRVDDEAIKSVLKQLAADEGRHARHGWDVVDWCLAEGGNTVADALRRAIVALPTRSEKSDARDDRLEAFGVASATLERQCFDACRAHVVERMSSVVHLAHRAA